MRHQPRLCFARTEAKLDEISPLYPLLPSLGGLINIFYRTEFLRFLKNMYKGTVIFSAMEVVYFCC